MAPRNWIGLFSRSQEQDLSNDLERGYEAALLIQSLELEYYGDRRVRPELELSVPRSVQATILRKFRSALEVCRSSLELLRPNRAQLDMQELRQLLLLVFQLMKPWQQEHTKMSRLRLTVAMVKFST